MSKKTKWIPVDHTAIAYDADLHVLVRNTRRKTTVLWPGEPDTFDSLSDLYVEGCFARMSSLTQEDQDTAEVYYEFETNGFVVTKITRKESKKATRTLKIVPMQYMRFLDTSSQDGEKLKVRLTEGFSKLYRMYESQKNRGQYYFYQETDSSNQNPELPGLRYFGKGYDYNSIPNINKRNLPIYIFEGTSETEVHTFTSVRIPEQKGYFTVDGRKGLDRTMNYINESFGYGSSASKAKIYENKKSQI